MADGSIRVSTELDIQETKADLNQLEQECKKTAAKIAEVGKTAQSIFTGISPGRMNSALNKANKELGKTQIALTDIEDQIKAIQTETDRDLQFAVTDDQAATLLEIEEQQMEPLLRQRDELTQKAQEYKRQIEAITAELNEQAQIEAAQKTMNSGVKAVMEDEGFLSKIRSEQEYHAALETTKAKMAAIEQQAERISRDTGVQTAQLLKQNTQYQKLVSRLALLEKNQGKFKGKVSETTKSMISLEKQVKKTGNSMQNSFNHGIKRLARLSLGILGVEGAFTLLRRATNAYMESNEGLTNQLNGLWNVLGYAIGPILEKLVNWLTIAISYINAFVSALTGVDFVAKANAAALKKQTTATKEAAKASKTLAGFDEMNKLSDTSSSGSAGTESNSAAVFQPVPVDDTKIAKLVEMFETIKENALLIGSAILGWKLGGFIADLVTAGFKAGGLLETLKLIGKKAAITVGITIAIAGIALETKGIISAIKEELNKVNFAEILAGGGLTIAGAALIGSQFGATLLASGIGAIIAGIPMYITGIYDACVNGLNMLNALLIPVGSTLAGAGIGAIIGSLGGPIGTGIGALIGLIVGAVTDLVILIIENWESIVDWVDKNIVQPMGKFFEPLINAAKTAWAWIDEHILQPVFNFFLQVWDAISTVGGLIIEKAWEIISGVGEAIWSIIKKIGEIFAKIVEIFVALGKAFYTYVIKPVIDFIAGLANKIYNALIKPIIDWFAGVGEWVYEKIIKPVIDKIVWLKDKAIELFKNVGTTVVNFVSGLFKSVINGVLAGIEWAINGFIKMLNGAIGLINKIPGVDIKKVELLSIPRLARGGIVNNPGRGVPVIAGEAGTEAVLPLERNTEWMDILAEKINGSGQLTIPIILSGKKIAEYVVELRKKKAFAMNGG